jgi:hypothetical protein
VKVQFSVRCCFGKPAVFEILYSAMLAGGALLLERFKGSHWLPLRKWTHTGVFAVCIFPELVVGTYGVGLFCPTARLKVFVFFVQRPGGGGRSP